MKDEIGQKIKEIIKNVILKRLKRKLIVAIIIIIIIIVPIAGGFYIITNHDALLNDDDKGNTPSQAAKYKSSIEIDEDGKIKYGTSIDEIWKDLVENESNVKEYISDKEVLAKLVGAEVATAFPDTREDVTQKIDWQNIKFGEGDVQGVVKFKRTKRDGSSGYITYASPSDYYAWIEDYNVSGSQSAYDNAMSHFTIEKKRSASRMNAQAITDGESIEIPDGLGSYFTYESWDYPLGTYGMPWAAGTNQLRFWQEADGLNSYDEEGFGVVNGRYVIACAETYGEVGDYVDFYQSDGTIINCVIGDMKSSSDAGYSVWGHDNGNNIIEFMVKTDLWYTNGVGTHANAGTETCHPEWGGKTIVKAVNGGSYFDNPNFGKEEITEKKKSSNSSKKDSGSDSNTQNSSRSGDIYTEASEKIVEAAKNTADRGAGLCEAWVGDVYDNSGYGCVRYESATADYEASFVSTSMDNIPVGATVFSDGSNPVFGHVGIYIGDGMVMHQASTVVTWTLEEFAADGWRGWGWNSPAAADLAGNLVKEKDTGDLNTTQYKMKPYVVTVANWKQKTTIQTTNDGNTAPDGFGELSEGSASMGTQKIDYQKMTSQFSLPFNLLWDFAVIGQNEEFVLDWADLVYNGKFEITIYDNYTKDTDYLEETYSRENKYNFSVTMQKGDRTATTSYVGETTTTGFVRTKEVINESIMPTAILTRANCWFADYRNSCKVKRDTKVTEDSKELGDEEFNEAPATDGFDMSLVNGKIPEGWKYVSHSVNRAQSRRVSIVDKTTHTVETTKYTKNTPSVKGKTGENKKKSSKKKKEKVESLDGFLFIGDSITNGLGQSGNITEDGVIFRGVGSSTPAHWLNDGGGEVGQTNSTLPEDSDDIKAISIMLGTNGLAVDYYTVDQQFNDMVQVIESVHEKYPNKTIFVQKIFYIYSEVAKVDEYNSKLSEYCDNSDYAVFIDATDGVELADGVHPTSAGYAQLAENIRSEIIGREIKSGGSSSKGFVSLLKEKKYKGVVGNIESASDMLFELIEKNEDTADLIDLMKYLLTKATGEKYTTEEFDFSVFKLSGMSSGGSNGTGKIDGDPDFSNTDAWITLNPYASSWMRTMYMVCLGKIL